MMELYVLYHQNTPFPGYIIGAGKVDRSETPDGSTMAEHVVYLLNKYQGSKLKYLPLGPIPDKESKKIVGNNLAPLAVNDITPAAQMALDATQETQDAANDYPNWGSVVSEIASAFSDPKQKAFILKLARTQFWRTRGKPV